MRFYILNAKISGIKNINKEIELSFYNKQLDKKFDSTHCNVKAIYGMNGAGKTGIIEAFDIYKGLVLEDSYLTLNNAHRFLRNIINQQNKTFSISVTFASIDDENILMDVFEHSFVLINKNDEYVIKQEELVLLGNRINSNTKRKIVYKTLDGKITDCAYPNRQSVFREISQNLLAKQSLTSVFFGKREIWDKNSEADYAIVSAIVFATETDVLLNETDKDTVSIRSIILQNDALKNYLKQIGKDTADMDKNISLSDRVYYDDSKAIITKQKKKQYAERIAKMTEFLKVFVPDLEKIDIKYEENGEKILCENILVYKNNKRVSKKYESTGVKKLMNLYDAFIKVNAGGIVLIDEFDANIHDVLLSKLIDYVRRFAKGQFIFTTHNLGPMNLLQRDKYSIDFLSSDSTIVSWIKSGNSVAANMYRNGLIENSPFNIDAEDFWELLTMNKLLIFCVETTKSANTDYLYIKSTVEYYYDCCNVSLKPVYMESKCKYKSASVLRDISDLKRSVRDCEVIYCVDTDRVGSNPNDCKLNDQIKKYCSDKGYKLVFFNPCIESVYWGKISAHDKIKVAAAFKRQNKIQQVPENKLSNNSCGNHSTNLLAVLDDILQRKTQ